MKKVICVLLLMLLVIIIFVPVINAKIDLNEYQESHLILFQRESNNRGPIIDRIINLLKKIPFINRTINFIKGLFGIVEEETDIVKPDDVFFAEPYIQDFDGVDPSLVTPTDTSISVNIHDFDITYTVEDKTFEFDIFFKGRTSGDVYACYWMIVTYFNDGTSSYYNLWNGPIDYPDMEFGGNTFDIYFVGKGPGGKSDWSSFEGRQYVTGPITDPEAMPVQPDKGDKYAVDAKLYVRAYSDEAYTMWNQDSKSVFNELSNTLYKDQKTADDDDDKGIPGFELIPVILSIVIVLILIKKKKASDI